MSRHLPPGPWTYETTHPDGQHGTGHVYLIDANSRKIASIWGTGEEKIALVNLIISAEREGRLP